MLNKQVTLMSFYPFPISTNEYIAKTTRGHDRQDILKVKVQTLLSTSIPICKLVLYAKGKHATEVGRKSLI